MNKYVSEHECVRAYVLMRVTPQVRARFLARTVAKRKMIAHTALVLHPSCFPEEVRIKQKGVNQK
jgi:hypothetical protein